MKKLFTFFALTVIGFVAAFAEEMAVLKVTVVDEEINPVEGAYVYFMGVEQYTNERGSATIEVPESELTESSYPVTVYKDGYAEATETATFKWGMATVRVILTAEEATLTFKVTDEDYEPIADAFITVNDQEYFTNESGTVFIGGFSAPEVLGKTVAFTVYKDGYDFYEGEVEFDMLEAQKWVQLTACEATLTIKVTDEDYEPIADAYVTVNDQEYFTNESGTVFIGGFSAPEVLGKTVQFTVYKDGYDFYEGEVEFDMLEAQKWVQLTACEATLMIKVTDPDYEPVADATVTVNGEEYTTNESGSVFISGFSAPEVLGKTVQFTVAKEGYETYEGEVEFEMLEAQAWVQLTPIQTGIDSVISDSDNSDAKIYDLNGRRAAAPQSGRVYIVNGQKVLINR